MSKKLKILAIAAGSALLAVIVALVCRVDDWGRDLSTNSAETSPDAEDPTLRTLKLPAAPNEVAAAIADWAGRENAWVLKEITNEQEQGLVVALIHTTRWLGFQDDVRVVLAPSETGKAETGTTVDVTSQSRIGKGDLGQNPRNIRELLRALRELGLGNATGR